MTTILLVCGAGASSTFLASRMRALVTARELPLVIQASSDDNLDTRLDSVDVLLVGAHLAEGFPELHRVADAHGVAIALLPPTVFGAGGAESALDLAISLAPIGQFPSPLRTKDTTHG